MARTAFSLLRGASRPSELIEAAAQLGYRRIAVTDRNGLYVVVQSYRAGQMLGVEVIPGAELELRPPSGGVFKAGDPTLVLLDESVRIADLCTFRLNELYQDFTLEVLPEGETGMGYLRKLVERGVEERWPEGVPAAVQTQVEHELGLIDELDFSGYFLTVWDIVHWARSQGILCQGRGSAANSIVCPEGVVLHYGAVAQTELRWFGPVPATDPLRTLQDCAADHMPPELLRSAALDALDRGRVARSELAGIEAPTTRSDSRASRPPRCACTRSRPTSPRSSTPTRCRALTRTPE